MRWAFFALIAAHGLIHFLGFAKAYGLYDPPQLTQPLSKPWGLVWLAAGALTLGAGALLLASWRAWWAVGLAAVALSQVAIFSSWADAKFGTVANVMLAGVLYNFASGGPLSFRSQYRRYLRQAGVVGRPRVHHFRAAWRGRIRAGADEPWMAFTAEQHNFPAEPVRFFRMSAERRNLPVDVYHALRDHSASMRVRLLSLVPIVDARGPEMDRAETVTLLNDLCLLAPSELVGPAIRWEPIDEWSARAHYTQGAHTVSALLLFNAAGELVDFVSDDRLAASADGREFSRRRWSTPVGEYRSFGSLRVATRGQGRWHLPGGDFAYIELDLVALEVHAAGAA